MKHTGMTARITNRTVTVIGAGVSGRSLTRFLVNHGAHVFVSDRNALSSEVCRELETLGVEWEEGHSHRALEADFLVLSSGIPPSAPLVKEAANAAVPVVGEVDVLSPYLRGAVIGVTGSNGKSTTTAIAGHLLRQAGYRTAVAGNIGTPLADIADDQWDYVIAELSSFQLHWARSLSLSGAVLTNIAPDHIDWHGTFEQYAATKRKINDFVLPGGFLVCPQQELPYMQRDDVKIVSLGDKGSCPDAGGNVLSSTETSWLLRLDGEWHRLFSGADVPLAGSHNEENVAMAGACAACLIGPRDVGPLLQGFQGLAHRCQPFCEVNGCTFIDDSKGTNVAATKTAIRSFEEGLIVLLGGKGKGEDYTELAETVAERVRFAVLLGEERYRIARSLDALGYRSYVSVASMEEAVEAALCRSGPGDVVLLSPACTSWDMYHNFGERGDHFQALVCERVRSGRTSGGFA